MNKVTLTIRLDTKFHKILKKKIIDSEYKSLQELTVKLYNDWLKNQ